MNRFFTYLLLFLILLVILISSYFVFFSGETTDNNDDPSNGEPEDTEPPSITYIPGDLTVEAGAFVDIIVTFEDNVAVTNATLFYKKADANTWKSVNILNSNAEIETSPGINETWWYYAVINDAAGNGPIGDPSINGSSYYMIMSIYEEDPNGNDQKHTVFIEKTTAVDCKFCPYMSDKIETLFESNEYNFYYVTLVKDKIPDADNRLEEYNLYANPSLFIDGGYEVIISGLTPLADIKKAIRAAEQRTVPPIEINISATYADTTDTLESEVLITNYDNIPYLGNLRVYLTEKISSAAYTNYNNSKYKYEFKEYLLNTAISLDGETKQNYTDSFPVGSYDIENLILIAVVFNQNTNTGFANPPDENPFDAHYADACAAAEIVEGGNLPPSIGITSPEQGKIYYRGRPVFNFIYNTVGRLRNTVVLGPMTFIAVAEDDTGITKVEFYLNDELLSNDTQPPYEFNPAAKLFRSPSPLPQDYTLTVIAYDTNGKSALTTLQFIAWRVFPK